MISNPSEFQSLDDMLNATYKAIISNGQLIESKRGKNYEITQYSATLSNPRVRTSMSLDRKLVKSKFAEFAWYLSKDKDRDYIIPYISAYNLEEQENRKILGAYGPKIFGSTETNKSQFERIIEQISKRNNTKQAYLTISEIEDYKHRENQFSSPPCTIGLHFLVRENKLNLTTYMRSNDAYYGLPHDLFCFTMLQELVACRTNLTLGKYTHIATSMHIYEDKVENIQNYLEEGLHEPLEMPPIKDCENSTLELISKEFDLTHKQSYLENLNDYWKDYALFSSKHYLNGDFDTEIWLNKFTNANMKLIANNSIGK